MEIGTLCLVLVAPLPYWALGLPWLSSDRLRVAPLLGCALAGLYAEWAMIAALPVRTTVALALVVSCAVAIYRRHELGGASRALLEWLPFYWVSVLAASISPFPVLGSWSGDWLVLYQMGEAVAAGDLPKNMLTRPPLFGASTVPLWLLQPGLIPYQLMAAVASASAITTTFRFVRHLRANARLILLVPLVISPFFLHHTAAAWGKFLAGGLVVAALIEALRRQQLPAALLFALAVAVHEGFVIWAPCLLLCQVHGRSWRSALKGLLLMAGAGVFIVSPYVLWVIAKYGLGAKIAASPVLNGVIPLPWWQRTGLGILASFIGWGPIQVMVRWCSNPDAGSLKVIVKESYWLATSWITTLASTMVGFLLPFLIAIPSLRASPRRAALSWPGVWTNVGIGIAVFLNSALAAFYSNEGTMQNALLPLALIVYAYLVTELGSLEDRASAALRQVTWLSIATGTAPWLILNAGISAALWLSAGVRQRFALGSEGDYFRVVDNHLHPLGLAVFPAVPCLCVVLLVGWFSLPTWRIGGRWSVSG